MADSSVPVDLLSVLLAPSSRTHAGYGMAGRGAQRCDKGFWNAGNNYDACTACPFGTTTKGPGSGLSAADCVVELGRGNVTGVVQACPIGRRLFDTVTRVGSIRFSGLMPAWHAGQQQWLP